MVQEAAQEGNWYQYLRGSNVCRGSEAAAAMGCCCPPTDSYKFPNCFPHSGLINWPFRVDANCVSYKLGVSILMQAEIRKAPISSDRNIMTWFKVRFHTVWEFHQEESLRLGSISFRRQIENTPAAFAALC